MTPEYLAADLAHGAVARFLGEGEAGGRLDPGGVPEDPVDGRDGVLAPDRVLHGDVEVGEEAGVDLAVRGEAQPAAPGAEGLRDGRYDAEGAGGAVELVLVCGRGGVVFFDRLEVSQFFLGPLQDLASRDEELAEAGAVGVAVEGHELYEADVHGVLEGELRHVGDLVVVDAAHGDGVDLDGRERRLEGRHQRAPDLLEVVAAGDKAELLGLEGVQGDVNPVEPGLDEAFEVLLEQVAVARHGHLVETEVLEPADELDDAAPDERLAAGDADLVDA